MNLSDCYSPPFIVTVGKCIADPFTSVSTYSYFPFRVLAVRYSSGHTSLVRNHLVGIPSKELFTLHISSQKVITFDSFGACLAN